MKYLLAQTEKMSISCDVSLNDKFNVHFALIPKIGLIMVNDLQDFGEFWLQVKVVEEWKSNPMYHFTTLSGGSNDVIQACARSFIDGILKCIHKKSGPTAEKIGITWNFVMNISLRPEIMNNLDYINVLSDSFHKLVNDKLKENELATLYRAVDASCV